MSLYFFTAKRIFWTCHVREICYVSSSLCRSVCLSSPSNVLLMYFFPITRKPTKFNGTMSKNVDKFVIGKSIMQLETMATARQLVNINCCVFRKNAAFSKKSVGIINVCLVVWYKMDGLSGHIGGSHINTHAQTYFRDLIHNKYIKVTEDFSHQSVSIKHVSFPCGLY